MAAPGIAPPETPEILESVAALEELAGSTRDSPDPLREVCQERLAALRQRWLDQPELFTPDVLARLKAVALSLAAPPPPPAAEGDADSAEVPGVAAFRKGKRRQSLSVRSVSAMFKQQL